MEQCNVFFLRCSAVYGYKRAILCKLNAQITTRSSAVAKRPRDASCQRIYC